MQEDLVEHTLAYNLLEENAEAGTDRTVIIHPYMKASIEKEFLIDTGIPLNSTGLSENYKQIMTRTDASKVSNRTVYDFNSSSLNSNSNKLCSNINLGSVKSQETSFVSNKPVLHNDLTNGINSILNKYDTNGNIAAANSTTENQRKSRLGIPKKFIHHERFESNQLLGNNEFTKDNSGKQSTNIIPPSPNLSHCNEGQKPVDVLPIHTNKTGIKFNSSKPSGNSLLYSKQMELPNGNGTNYTESASKNINEPNVHSNNTNQSNDQNESSSSIKLRYQMFKPKSSVKETDPNISEANRAKSNSPGSKLKRAFLSTLGRSQNKVKQNTLVTFRKDIQSNETSEHMQQIPASSSKISDITNTNTEVRRVEPTRKTSLVPKTVTKQEDEALISGDKPLLKQTSLIQPTFHRNVTTPSPKDQNRKSIHVMESSHARQKKYPEHPSSEKHSDKSTTLGTEHSSNEPKENLNGVDKQTLLPNYQNKRKSMYQPSDRDSLLTTFFKGQTLKYQPKALNERKNSVPCLLKEQSNCSLLESKIGSINNTLPRPQKIAYQNQSPNPNFKKNSTPEESGIVQAYGPSIPNKHNSRSNSTLDLRFVNDSMSGKREKFENGRDLEYNKDANLNNKSNEEKQPVGITRQSKINHLDLQNNEFVFYKSENNSDVEIGHVDSPRNSFISDSDQGKNSPKLLMNLPNAKQPKSAMVDETNQPIYNEKCKELLPSIPKNDIINSRMDVRKPFNENDITQKILNLTNEVETIDHYLNSEATSISTSRRCISPLKDDVIIRPKTPQHEDTTSQQLHLILTPDTPDSPHHRPTGIMKKSPSVDKKKVMFINDQVISPEECQRLSLNFEQELNELNSKIEQINEEIRIETLHLEQAKNKNNANETHALQCKYLNQVTAAPAYSMNTLSQVITKASASFSNKQLQPNDGYRNNDNALPENTTESKDILNTQSTLDNINENQVLQVKNKKTEDKPPPLSPRCVQSTQHTANNSVRGITPSNIVEKIDLRNTPTEMEQSMAANETRVLRESKLIKRQAHRRSYDERISKLDFHGFSKKSTDATDSNNFNKHSSFRRSFDDKNYPPTSASNESLVTDLPPKAPPLSSPGTTTVVTSGLKKVSNYQIFSDRRKNILENKSFTVRIGSRNMLKNSENKGDVSHVSNGLLNNSSSLASTHKQENIHLNHETKTTNESPLEANMISAHHGNELELRQETNVNKATHMIANPRVSVSPLKYSSAHLKKPTAAGYTEVKTKTPEPVTRYRQDVNMRNRSISPLTVADDNTQKQTTQTNNSTTEVTWRRQTYKMQTPRSISQVIESQIPGLHEEDAPPLPVREKTAPDQNHRALQMKPRLIAKSPSPSKILQPRYESTPDSQQGMFNKRTTAPPSRPERFADHSVDGVRNNASSENQHIEMKKIPSPNIPGRAACDNITKVVKVGPSYSRTNQNDNSASDTKSGVTTVVMVRRSPSSTSDSLARYNKSQGNLSKNSSESLTNRSEPSSETSDSKIPGKKHFKGSKFSCLRSDQDSFYKHCHMSSDERPRSCIIPNGIHLPDKSNASLKSISEENLQLNNRRASSAGAIPTGGGSKLPRRSIIKF